MNKINKVDFQRTIMVTRTRKMTRIRKIYFGIALLLLIVFGMTLYFSNNDNSIMYSNNRQLFLRDGNYFTVNYTDQSPSGVSHPDINIGQTVKVDGQDRLYVQFLITTHDDTATFEFILRI